MGEPIDGSHVPELSTTAYGKMRSRHSSNFWGPQDSCETYMHIDGDPPSCSIGSEDVLLNTDFHLDDFGMVSVVLSSDSLFWHIIELEDKLNMHFLCCWGSSESKDASNKLATSDIYAVELFEMTCVKQHGACPSVPCSNLSSDQDHHFAVHTYQKCISKKGIWIPKSYVFRHTDPHVCKRWANQLQCLVDKQINRPRNLWVIINPYSGRKTALKTWEEVSPLFSRAGINTKVLMTERIKHAFEIMNEASNAALMDLDGVIVVGGDGLFNEVLNGFLLRRHRAKWPIKPYNFERSHEGSSVKCESRGHNIKLEKRKEVEILTAFAEPDEKVDLMTLPASTDLHPLLENLTSADMAVSKKPSTYSLISDSKDDNGGSSKINKVTSAMTTNSCSDSVCDYGCIQFKEGGFVIPNSPVTTILREEQRSRPDFICSDPGSVLCNPKFRLGIIPAGSTDSIAISTTGSRDPATSALHIILGKSMPLDIVRLIGWKSSSTTEEERPRVRYAASFAGYGFYGDVIKESEPNRWMGPLRYDYAGTKVFLKHKLYEAEVSYVELPEGMANSNAVPHQSPEVVSWQRKLAKSRLSRKICRMNCGICAKGIDFSDLDDSSSSSVALQKKPRWRCSKGSFISVGAAVISCRNDKAPNGVAATAHLADGFLHLILVKECSRPAYLWHLIQLTREESNPLDFSFIEEHKTPQFNFISYGEESIWNVDGELFPASQLSAQVFRGLVNIFASGPDV